MALDLTPFGFTPTEGLVYAALLDRGFTSAYALAKHIGVARANVYQALNGLVTKGAAVRISENPQVYRPIGPSELLALLAQREAAQLEKLEQEVAQLTRVGEQITVKFSGRREFGELALRTATRAMKVSCLAPPGILASLNPVWRKRAADAATTVLWAVGKSPKETPVEVRGELDETSALGYFHGPPVVLVSESAAMLGCEPPEGELGGFWSSEALLAGAVRATLETLTRLTFQ